jgi:hypothetical protein
VDDEARERALLVRQIRAARGANVLAASATGVLAAYEAAASGDEATLADDALAALGQTLPLTAQVSDADVDAELAQVDEAVRGRREAAARTGFDPGTAPTAVDVGTTAAASAPVVPRGPVAAGASGAGAVVDTGIASAQGGGVDLTNLATDRAMQLLPPSYREVAQGVQALANGDYKTAIKSVASHVPGPLGAALKGAIGLFGG